MEVSSLLSIAIGRLARSTCSGLWLLLAGAGHCDSARISFCAWPTIHHCGGHCQDWPGLVPDGRPADRERETADLYLSYVPERYEKGVKRDAGSVRWRERGRGGPIEKRVRRGRE